MILYMNTNTNCVNAWLYSFEDYHWIHLNQCIYVPNFPPLHILDNFNFNLMCASGKDKELNGSKILVILDDFVESFTNSQFIDVFLVDIKSTSAIQINHSLKFSKAMSVFENQGRLFILTSNVSGSTNVLHLHALVDTEIVLMQNVSMKMSFVANSMFQNDVPSGNDYITLTGQLNKKLKT